MRDRVRGQFLLGLASGLLLGSAGLLLASGLFGNGNPASVVAQGLAMLSSLWEMAQLNLRGAAFLFVLVLVFYGLQLSKLNSLLAAPEPPVERVVRHEQLLDLCASLFFGIGVIWTAIGMRDALLFALGDPDSAATEGAFAVLQRLVDGGILLALSTTIVGGIGGYLMRAGKSVFLGQKLAELYLRMADHSARESLTILQRIEGHLDQAGRPVNGGTEAP